MALGKAEPLPSAATDANSDDGSIVPIDQAYVCRTQSRAGRSASTAISTFTISGTPSCTRSVMIGLDHPDSTGAVMAFRYDERVRDLQPSDIDGVQRLYGAPASAD